MDGDSTRWTVITRAAAGSAADRDEFAVRYGPVIRAYLGARWRGTPLFDQVDDAAQQVFIECFKKGGALERADPTRGPGFRAFLYGVVRNVALTFERKRRTSREQQPESDLDLDRMAGDEDSLTQVFDRAWASAVLKEAALLQLERARAKGENAVRRHRLLAVRYGDGLPIREIAKLWGVDPAVLHREYPKARAEFRAALEDVVRELSGDGSGSVAEECASLLAKFS